MGAVETVRGSRVTASIGNGAEVDRESPLAVTLVQCVPRGDRMDFIVQKATELGVAPGIVVGRLQHEKLIPYTHLNGLKQTFCFKEEAA